MNDSFLKSVLKFDIWASAASGVFAIAGARLVGNWLDISPWVSVVFGCTLIPWVWLLVTTERRTPIRGRDVNAVIAGNIGFGVVAVAVVFGFPDALSTSGKWIVAIFGLLTADLGVAEWVGLRRRGASMAGAPLPN